MIKEQFALFDEIEEERAEERAQEAILKSKQQLRTMLGSLDLEQPTPENFLIAPIHENFRPYRHEMNLSDETRVAGISWRNWKKSVINSNNNNYKSYFIPAKHKDKEKLFHLISL